MKNNIILTIVCCMLMSSTPHKYTMLCLGDSYTIGEAVAEEARFPNQAAALLESKGFAFDKPKIIAKTGWTTDELAAAIVEEKPAGKFDVVTLLIGVNNQYRSRDKENYRQEFTALLHTAIAFSESGKKGVFVVSIPDWGVTPFAKKDSRPAKEIGAQIDAFNAIVNFSRHGDLRVDIALAVDPGTDIAKARQVILAVCGSNEKVLKTPAPSVSVLKMADGAVTLAIRPYATPANYWDVYFGIQEEIKIAFEQAGIQGPTPHRVIITKS
jgi:lysophospholipase L1-like esterase